MRLADCRVAILGLGLMGGSLAAGLRGRCRLIVGADHDPEALRLARQRGWIDTVADEPAHALEGCDLAVLAVPVRAGLEMIGRMGQDLPAPPRLLDLGSTKSQVLQAMEVLPTEVDPLGGHPLCGRETSGAAAADPTLFQGCQFGLFPLPRTGSETLALARELVTALGAVPLTLDPLEHDRLTALTSHLPYLLAAALAARAAEVEAGEPLVRRLAASGFRDATRLAASEVTMMLDILATNRENLRQELESLMAELERWKALLAAGDEHTLRAELAAARDLKRRWMNEHGS